MLAVNVGRGKRRRSVLLVNITIFTQLPGLSVREKDEEEAFDQADHVSDGLMEADYVLNNLMEDYLNFKGKKEGFQSLTQLYECVFADNKLCLRLEVSTFG